MLSLFEFKRVHFFWCACRNLFLVFFCLFHFSLKWWNVLQFVRVFYLFGRHFRYYSMGANKWNNKYMLQLLYTYTPNATHTHTWCSPFQKTIPIHPDHTKRRSNEIIPYYYCVTFFVCYNIHNTIELHQGEKSGNNNKMNEKKTYTFIQIPYLNLSL